MNRFIVVLVTCPSVEEAEKIGKLLVTKSLVACVNVIPEVKSIFFWEKKISKEKEVLLMAKTRKELFDSIQKEIRRLHSYDLPEIIALPIEIGSKGYLEWVARETQE